MSAAAAAPAHAATRPARPRSALLPLARVEGRRLLRHPLFVLGMVISSAILVLASGELARHGIAMGAADRTEIVNFLAGDSFVMVGAAFWTFLATFLAASREGRDLAGDFYAGQPVAQPVRTAAALLSTVYGGLAALALISAATVAFLGVDGALWTQGTRYAVRPLELLQGPLYVVMAGALGVLAGTWTRHVYVGVFAAVALFLPPIALVPWLVLDDTMSRGFYGAFMAGLPAGWHGLAIVGTAVLAAALAIARHDRRPRVALLAGGGLAAVVVAALGVPSMSLGAACAPAGSDTPPTSVAARGVSGNLDFEHGSLDGWRTSTRGQAPWRIYPDATQPAPRVGPPQGRFAALADPCGPGSRILFRDLTLDGARELRLTLSYASLERLASPPTLDHEVDGPNQRLRVDIVDPAAAVDSLAARDVLATVFETKPGHPQSAGPRRIRFDLSPWADRTVRLRVAEVDNQAPLRAVVDDVQLKPIG